MRVRIKERKRKSIGRFRRKKNNPIHKSNSSFLYMKYRKYKMSKGRVAKVLALHKKKNPKYLNKRCKRYVLKKIIKKRKPVKVNSSKISKPYEKKDNS